MNGKNGFWLKLIGPALVVLAILFGIGYKAQTALPREEALTTYVQIEYYERDRDKLDATLGLMVKELREIRETVIRMERDQ